MRIVLYGLNSIQVAYVNYTYAKFYLKYKEFYISLLYINQALDIYNES